MDDADLERSWPPFAIRIRCGNVSLRPLREADLPSVVAMLPDDLEHDPASEMFAQLDPEANRRRIFLQTYWRSPGSWSPDSWWLPFLVRYGDQKVGIQTVEGDHFPELRVIDSWSFLERSFRGRGIGVIMRASILALAFDHLGAEFAVSSAREDNGPSLGVSRRLGYQHNGISRSRSPSGPCTLLHMILPRARWDASEWPRKVDVAGLDACEPWFGVQLVH